MSLAILVLVACQSEDGRTEAVSVATPVVSEAAGPVTVALPFENPFPNRLNSANDGTPFEPCVAFSDDELLRFDVEPSAIEDAAIVDGQGIRGCDWFMPRQFALGVVVTNATSLSEYKSGTGELAWKDDFFVRDRRVGLAQLNGEDRTCKTYVQSLRSIVVTTIIVTGGVEARKRFDPCEIAVEFTTAYIDKIPD